MKRVIVVVVLTICFLYTPSLSMAELTKKDLEEIRVIVKEEIGHVDKRLDVFEKSVDNRFVQIDKRLDVFEKSIDNHFEQIDKRFEFMQNLMIAMLAVFGSLCGVFAGLLLWDRKTFMEKAKDNAMKEIEEKYKINSWLEALKEFSKTHNDLADIMRRLHL